MHDVPYGLSYFPTMRRERLVYVDKTSYIRRLETSGRAFVVYLRPRRFGKSTLLSTLEHYYARNYAAEFKTFFGDLDIGRDPTPKRNSYLTLRLEFTGINTDGSLEDCMRTVYLNMCTAMGSFCHDYQALVPGLADFAKHMDFTSFPATLLQRLFSLVRDAGLPLYLLVDEYDNFTNSLIARGREELYLQLTHDGGFMRELYKAIKGAMATGAVQRIFLTGVSPVTLDDITSGANIFTNISQEADLSAMSGFTQGEVEALLERALALGQFTLSREVVLADMKTFYNGYRFSEDAAESVYNPDMVLYFLMKLRSPDRYPREILDNNVRIDYGRLRSLIFTASGAPRADAIETVRAALEEGAVQARVRESFPLKLAYEGDFFASLLYYLGMLTYAEPGASSFRAVVPNSVSRELYLESFAYLVAELAQVEMVGPPLEASIAGLAYRGDPAPFLTILQTRVLQYLSRRDMIKLDERSVKFIALAFLGMVDLFIPFSEMEHVGGFSDLLLPVNQRKYPDSSYSWLFEFKYLKVADSRASAAKKDRKGPAKASSKPPKPSAAVERALDEAEAQLARYQADPRLCAFAGPKGWRSVAVACVGATALYFREPGQPTRSARPE